MILDIPRDIITDINDLRSHFKAIHNHEFLLRDKEINIKYGLNLKEIFGKASNLNLSFINCDFNPLIFLDLENHTGYGEV